MQHRWVADETRYILLADGWVPQTRLHIYTSATHLSLLVSGLQWNKRASREHLPVLPAVRHHQTRQKHVQAGLLTRARIGHKKKKRSRAGVMELSCLNLSNRVLHSFRLIFCYRVLYLRVSPFWCCLILPCLTSAGLILSSRVPSCSFSFFFCRVGCLAAAITAVLLAAHKKRAASRALRKHCRTITARAREARPPLRQQRCRCHASRTPQQARADVVATAALCTTELKSTRHRDGSVAHPRQIIDCHYTI